MIDSIIKLAAADLANLPFLEKVGGIVTPLKKKTKAGRVITTPVDYTPLPSGKLNVFVPDNKIVGMAYFELEGESNQRTTSGKGQIRAEVVLAAWVNVQRVLPADIGVIKRAIIYAMPSTIYPEADAGFSAANIAYIGGASINATFGRYGYDNDESKMFRYPFCGFGLKFSVTYIPNLCFVDVQVVENNDCFNPDKDCL